MSSYKILGLSDSDIWNQLIKQLPIDQQDVYFTPEYYRLYEANGDGKALCFVFDHDGDIALYPFLLSRINDLGYTLGAEYYDVKGAYGYNGVVSTNYHDDFRKLFHERLKEYAIESNIVCEFLRFHPLLSNVKFSAGYKNIQFDRQTVSIDLNSDYEHIWNREYNGKNRNKIRKCLESDMNCTITSDLVSSDDFMGIYYDTMERLAADDEYFFSENYFRTFKNELTGSSFVVSCESEKGIESMALFLHRGQYAHYHLSGRAIFCNHSYITNAILDTAIKHAKEMGCLKMHLGGGRTNAEDDSLLTFKKNFSRSTNEFYIGKRIYNQVIYDLILDQWQASNPLSAMRYGHMLQGYMHLDK